ncbi:MAG TPA: hypothetical protein DD640_05835 [Clostridiales bacterium]|nr:hypothetical protein [Clostridiales bacterium]
MNTLDIPRLTQYDILPAALINQFPWPENDYRPRAEARAAWTPDALHFWLTAWEAEPLTRFFEHQSPVYTDSCLEFFLNACPDAGRRYLNFEFNSAGSLLLYIGDSRYSRKSLKPAELGRLKIRAGQQLDDEPRWQIACVVPLDLLEDHFGHLAWGPGLVMAGNFYKCGDQTAQPHCACWNPITASKPDFHRPEDFGRLILT